MIRRPPWLAALAAACLAATAHAQGVQVAPLAAPDLFSPGARDTGLPGDLWRGTSPRTMAAVLPLVSAKPLSPAARALALRVLATGAAGPQGAGEDPALAGARIEALIALGDAPGAAAILSRTANVERSPALAQAAAEAALLAGDDARACQIGESLAADRDAVYWLRLRAFCRQRAGDAGAARLTFDLAQGQARDAVFGRLMGAKLAGAGDPGAASLRNGLDYALSRSLGLDLSQAKPAPAVAAALSGEAPVSATWTLPSGPGLADAAMAMLAGGDVAGARLIRAGLMRDEPGVSAQDLALLDAMLAAATGTPDGPTLDRLLERGGVGDAAGRARMQAAALYLAALGAPLSPEGRGELAAAAAGEAKAPPARTLAMDLAAEQKLMGETALLAIWTSADAGASGPAPADRARIVRALRQAGLEADARAFALEGLIALK
ncbi:MAG: hypothetical protein ACK4YQ_14360 [Phenylobacterium sp.]|uniref:hypothetical protein n=1 Tax=Phenylobacterium sp. TaxID=1871053 RepID=UPI00391A88C8